VQRDDRQDVVAIHAREFVSSSGRTASVGGRSRPVRAADAARVDGALEADSARQSHDFHSRRQHQRRRAEAAPARRKSECDMGVHPWIGRGHRGGGRPSTVVRHTPSLSSLLFNPLPFCPLHMSPPPPFFPLSFLLYPFFSSPFRSRKSRPP